MKKENETTNKQQAMPYDAVLCAGLSYFGTDLSNHGHYFWQLNGDRFERSSTYFGDLPFNPEELLPPGVAKGTVVYLKIDKYAVIAIAGSCTDNRGGTKSVFWTTEHIRLGDFKAIIFKIPIAKKIIDGMSFDVNWSLAP